MRVLEVQGSRGISPVCEVAMSLGSHANLQQEDEELWSPEEAGVNRVYVHKTSLATP